MTLADTLTRFWRTYRRRLRHARREWRLRQDSAHPAIAILTVSTMALLTGALVVYVLTLR
jgi:hypothetical protein